MFCDCFPESNVPNGEMMSAKNDSKWLWWFLEKALMTDFTVAAAMSLEAASSRWIAEKIVR